MPHVLIVEDEGITAKDLQAILERLGCVRTAIVSSGWDALQYVRASPPDVILMDVGLPGELDGTQTALRIRQMASIPVIFVTAHTDVATLRRIVATAPSGYIVKPYDQDELAAALKRALESAHSSIG